MWPIGGGAGSGRRRGTGGGTFTNMARLSAVDKHVVGVVLAFSLLGPSTTVCVEVATVVT